MSSHNSFTSRRVRRYIKGALTGAALSAGLVAIPAHAGVYHVTTLADDGTSTSLRGAITAANADTDSTVNIYFNHSLSGNFVLNSALPAITNPNVQVEVDLGQSITLPQALSIGGNGKLVIFDSDGPPYVRGGITGNVNVIGDANGNAEVDVYQTSQIIGNVTIAGTSGNSGTFVLGDTYESGSPSITGNVTVNSGGILQSNLNSSITGVVTVNGGQVTLQADSGVGEAGDPSIVGGPSIIGAVNASNGGTVNVFGGDGTAGEEGDFSGDAGANGDGANGVGGGSTSITGDITANDSNFTLTGGDGGAGGGGGYGGYLNTGDANGGNGGAGGNSSVNGDITANDSTFTLTGGAGGAGGDGDYGGSSSDTTGDANGGNGGAGGNSSIIGDITANDSTFTLTGGDGGAGGYGYFGGDYGVGDANGGAGGAGGNSSITGDITANDSTFTLKGGDGSYGYDGYFGGYYGEGDANGGAGGAGGNSSITGDITANDSTFTLNGGAGGDGSYGWEGYSGNANGGAGGAGGSSSIAGNVTANGSSSFTLTAGTGGTGGPGGTGGDNGTGNANGGAGGAGGSSSITGNVTVNGSSSFTLNGGAGGDGGAGGNGNANGTANGGNGGAGGDSYIQGNVTTNGSSNLILNGTGNAGTTGAIGNDNTYAAGGVGGAGGTAYINGNVTTNDSSQIGVSDGSKIIGGATANNNSRIYVGFDSSITGNAIANNNSGIYVGFDSSITGNAIANNNSGIFVGYNSGITGNVTANDNSVIFMGFGSSITGNAAFNDSSFLDTVGGGNALNTDGGTTTTSFTSGATFAPYLNLVQNGTSSFSSPGSPDTSNILTVNNLILNNSKLQPNWNSDGNLIPLNQTFDVLHYDGTLSGAFNSTVVSPFTFDINYGGESDGDVLLTLTGVNYTDLGGNKNQQSLENYLNHFYTISGTGYGGAQAINLDPNSELPFSLSQLTSELSYGGASGLNSYISDEYSDRNMQAYWSQQAFINSIADTLRNDSNMGNGGGAAFALNQTTNAGAGMQLASLRQAMTSMPGGLGVASDVGGASSGVWAAYTGAHQHTDADSSIGSNAWSSSSDGYTVGYTSGGDRFSWGAAVGHQKSTLNNVDSTGEVDGYNAGLYAAWKSKSTYLNAVLGYGNYDNTVYNTDQPGYKTHGLSAYLELGKRLKVDSKGGLSPYASLLWSRINNDSTTDSNDFNLESGSNNVYTTALGLRYNHRVFDRNDTLKGGWQAGLAWVHQFGDTAFPVNGNYTTAEPFHFQIEGTPLPGDAAQVQLGAYGRIHGSLIGFANYQGTFGSKQTINGVSAGVGYQF